jgi:hypothetical protein
MLSSAVKGKHIGCYANKIERAERGRGEREGEKREEREREKKRERGERKKAGLLHSVSRLM